MNTTNANIGMGSNVTIGGGGNEDQPASLVNDKLGFKPYVEAVYSYLINPLTKAPFTISIEGDWGSGKSSFMYQLEETLIVNHLKTIRFNAWRHDKVESMWAAFALHFLKDLIDSLPWYRRPIANLRLRIKRYDWQKGWISFLKISILLAFYVVLVVKLLNSISSTQNIDFLFKDDKVNISLLFNLLGTSGIVLGMLFFLNKAAEITGNPFKTDLQKFVTKPSYEGNAAFIEEFHRDFDQTVNLLTRDHEKIFIFIDDLDRAEIPKAAELMQGLNMMISNSPKLIFIIGMDREKVAAGVAAKYKDLLPFLNPLQGALNTIGGLEQAREFGYTFLEKFVQLSFQIPKPSVAFTEEFINSLSGAKAEDNGADTPIRYNPVLVVTDGEDTKQFREVILLLAPFFDHNPRRIKQFVNAFRLKAHIANSTGLFNDYGYSVGNNIQPLTIPQLGKFIALTMLWPKLIDDLIYNPYLLSEILNDKAKTSHWLQNDLFMSLLQIEPIENQAEYSYTLKFLDIIPLLKTSPPLQADSNLQQDSSDSSSSINNILNTNGRNNNIYEKQLYEDQATTYHSEPTEYYNSQKRNTTNTNNTKLSEQPQSSESNFSSGSTRPDNTIPSEQTPSKSNFETRGRRPNAP